MRPVINSSALIGGKFILKNPLQDLVSSLDAVTGHMVYNLTYT